MSRKKSTTAGPSKRQRVAQEEAPIRPTFVNARAEALFKESIVKRKCIPERKILTTNSSMDDIIEDRDWERFVASACPVLVPVIREFYANARVQLIEDSRTLQTLVRGKRVAYDRSSINALYELQEVDDEEYTEWLDSGPDYEAVLTFLASQGTQWKKTEDRVVNFPRGRLKVESRGWHYFISGSLLPTNHSSEVTRERALLNFAIQTGTPINVGRVIEQSLISLIRNERSGGLGHPSLIYALCLKAGVPTSAQEEIQHPLPSITHTMLISFKKMGALYANEAAAPTATEAGPSTEIPQADEASPSAQVNPPSDIPSQSQPHPASPTSATTPNIAELYERMEDMGRRQDLMYRRQSSMSHRIHNMAESQRQFQQYSTEFNEALITMFRSSTSFQGSSSVVFPTPPAVPPYTPPSPAGDSDSSADI